ncbi:hypothetical protein RCL1_007398 [Eukaryota sp. TZLM3-RCL]
MSLLEFNQFPPFDVITPDLLLTSLPIIFDSVQSQLKQLEQSSSSSYDDLIIPLSLLNDRLSTAWNIVSQLMAVANCEPLRNVRKQCLPLLVNVQSSLDQSKPIYTKLKQLQSSPGFHSLSTSQQRAVNLQILYAENLGVHLSEEKQQELKSINKEHARLSTKFSDNVVDSMKSFKKLITTETELEGVPQSVKDSMFKNASREQMDGWLVSLDQTIYLPLMKFARNRTLRRELYTAFVALASGQEFSNTTTLEEILSLRKQRAEILGFASHAHFSLRRKAISNDPIDVLDFLSLVQQSIKPIAQKEYELLCDYAHTNDPEIFPPGSEILPWDEEYYMEKIKEQYLNINEEELRPYFELQSVLIGLFDIVKKVFGVNIVRLSKDECKSISLTTWHEDCLCFSVVDDGQTLAYIIYDPFSRPATKTSGAFIKVGVNRNKLGDASLRLPLVYVNTNFTPSSNEVPCLLTFRQCVTLFHEFGHALHACLSTENNPTLSCLNGIERDCLEVPSQLMENFLYHAETVQSFAKHYITNEPLSLEIIQNLSKLSQFMQGTITLKKLVGSVCDIYLHYLYEPNVQRAINHSFDPNQIANDPYKARSAQEIYHIAAKKVALFPPIVNDHFVSSFRYIFSWGYDAGYYAYIFGKALAIDAWSMFKPVLNDSKGLADVGSRFRECVLARGGGQNSYDLFKLFRGRSLEVGTFLSAFDF